MKKQTKYRAIFYARVSTIRDEQAESIDNQILQAKNYLAKRPDIELVEPLDKYCEKVSAKSDERPKFQEVLKRLEKGDANLLIVKDMKRFSRSVEVSYRFFNMMEAYDIQILNLSTNKFIDAQAFEESESMILLGIEAIIAENQVRTQSAYGKIVQQIRCENKILSYKDAQLFGYYWDYEKGDISVDEEKAEIIRTVFDRYVFRRESIKNIRKFLLSIGHKKSAPTITKWLQEGKFIGDWTINRKSSKLQIGAGKKTKRFDVDKAEWIHIHRPDLAIVNQAVFNMAQKIRSENTRESITGEETKARFIGKHLFASKIYCAECGSVYRHAYADRAQTINIYRDSFGVKSMDKEVRCINRRYSRVYETDMKALTVAAYNELVHGEDYFDSLLAAIEQELMKDSDTAKRKKVVQANINKVESRMKKITDSFIDASPLMRQALNEELMNLQEQIDRFNEERVRIENESDNKADRISRIQQIRKRVTEWSIITEADVDRELVKALVKKILVHGDGKIEMQLNLSTNSIYDVLPESNNKENSKKGSPIIMQKTDYTKEARRVLDVISTSRKNNATIMTFEIKSSYVDERPLRVSVDLNIVSD